MAITADRVRVVTAADTEAFGADLAIRLIPGQTFHLAGDLGAGKTTLVRGILRGLGFAGPVRSPTYTLIEPYHIGGLAIYHMDFYRIEAPEELEPIGVREYLGGANLCFIEWAERAELPDPDVRIRISVLSEGRDIEISGPGTRALFAGSDSP